ncbi:MAG: lipopolysaccharide biosynthesis protein [Bryobacteraceae bacterium]|jgi:O-antigen/teichoic acid export membrane protein
MSPEGPPSVRSLDKAVAGGLAWAAGAKSATQFFTWAFTLITARLLSPSDFGLVNMAGFINILASALAEFGMGQAVLQMPELEAGTVAQLNTACVAICSGAYGLLVLAAPLFAAFFRSGQLRMLVVVNSIGLVITGLQSVPLGLLEKDLDYRRLSVCESVTIVVQAVVTVGFALSGFAYWSLVVGALAGRTVGAALTCYWKPVPFALPRWKQIQAPMRLGAHVAIGRIAFTAYAVADCVIVGRTLGGAALGAYQMAVALANAPAEKIGLLVMRVTGPLFARVQKDQELVRRYFRIISESVSLSVFPILVGLAVVAPEAVRVLLGPKWIAAVGPIRWLAVFMCLRTLSVLFSQVLTSLRYTRFNMLVSLISFVVMPVAFLVATRWGTNAVAASWLILSPVTVLPFAVKLLRAIGFRYRDYFSVLLPALAGCAVMVAAVLAVHTWLGNYHMPAAVRLSAQVAVGGAAYLGFQWIFYREKLNRYINFLLGLRRGRAVLSEAAL